MNEMDLLTDLLTSVPEPTPGHPTRAKTALDAAIRAEPAASARRVPRRRLAIAGAAAIVAAASIVTAYELQPASRTQATNPANVRLAAWTVAATHKHLLRVTIRRLHDPAGLERLLRRHGVPALVHFQTANFTPTTSPTAIPRGCHAPRMSDEALTRIEARLFPTPPLDQEQLVLLIRPAALPAGMGIFIKAAISKKEYHGIPQYLSVQSNLVLATKSCTS